MGVDASFSPSCVVSWLRAVLDEEACLILEDQEGKSERQERIAL
jgi:hypothetical protein